MSAPTPSDFIAAIEAAVAALAGLEYANLSFPNESMTLVTAVAAHFGVGITVYRYEDKPRPYVLRAAAMQIGPVRVSVTGAREYVDAVSEAQL